MVNIKKPDIQQRESHAVVKRKGVTSPKATPDSSPAIRLAGQERSPGNSQKRIGPQHNDLLALYAGQRIRPSSDQSTQSKDQQAILSVFDNNHDTLKKRREAATPFLEASKNYENYIDENLSKFGDLVAPYQTRFDQVASMRSWLRRSPDEQIKQKLGDEFGNNCITRRNDMEEKYRQSNEEYEVQRKEDLNYITQKKDEYVQAVDNNRLRFDEVEDQHPDNIRIFASQSQNYEAGSPDFNQNNPQYKDVGVEVAMFDRAIKQTNSLEAAIDQATSQTEILDLPGAPPTIQKPVSSIETERLQQEISWKRQDNTNENIKRVIINIVGEGQSADETGKGMFDKEQDTLMDNFIQQSVEDYKQNP